MLVDEISSIPTPAQETCRFLTFQLCQHTQAMVEVGSILTTLQVPREQIVPIPDMPIWVMGAYNWRGEILWIVDLAQHLELKDPLSDPRPRLHSVLITQVEELRMGIAVDQVHDVLSFSLEAIASAPAVTATRALASVLRGSVVNGQGSTFLWLEMKAIYQKTRDQIRIC